MTTSGEKVKSPIWRESSSLIICAKSLEKPSEYDYRILILKRSDRTALIKDHTRSVQLWGPYG